MISKQSVKKPFTVLVGVILVLVLGAVSLSRMATDLLPGISLPYLVVITTYPGASPEKVENELSAPLEQALGTVNGVENVTSTSNENYSLVTLEFADDTNMDSAMVKVSAAINQLADSLPDRASTPTIMEISADMMATEYVAVSYDGMDIYELSDYVENTVVPALERVDGVASVSAVGLVEKTVEVRLNQSKIDQVNDKLLVKVSDRLADAKKELEDAQKELNENTAKLADSRKELDDSKTDLADGKKELEDAKKELESQQEDTAARLAELSQQLDEGMATIAATNVQIQSAEAQKKALDEAVAKLQEADKGYTQLDAGLGTMKTTLSQQLSAQLEQLNAAVAAAGNPTPDDARQQLAAAQAAGLPEEQLAALQGLVQALTLKPQLEALLPQLDTLPGSMAALLGDGQKATVEANLALWQNTINALPLTEEQKQPFASILSLTADQVLQLHTVHTTTLPDLLKQQQQSAQQVEALQGTKKELEAKAAQLREAYKQLEAGKISAAAGFGSGSAQIASGLTTLESAEKQLDSGKTQLEASEKQLDSAREQLEDAWTQYYDAREEALANANLDQLLNMSTLAQIIGAQNFSMPAGSIRDGDTTYLVKVGETFESVDELEGALLCNIDGVGDVRLRDVADIVMTDNADDSYARMNREQAVLLSVFKGSTASTSEVSNACNARAAALMDEDQKLSVIPIMDQGEYIRLIVKNVLSNLIGGALLAIIVLALFLKDVRPTLVVAVSIPLSVLFAIVLMYFSGISLNIISLSGLALGIGMLVDNSIVVIENIYRLRARGVPAARAAVLGARQVSSAIIASTLTTICVFMPILFTDGMTRDLLTDMALTIGYALGASLVVALTVVPAAGSTVLRRTREIKHPLFDRLLAVYEKVLRGALKHKPLTLGLAVGMLVFGVWQLGRMGIVLIPSMSSNQLSVTYELPEDTTAADAYAAADALMDRAMEVEGVETVGAMSAGGAGAMMGMSAGGGSHTSFMYYITMPEDAGRSQQQVIDDLTAATADLPGEVTVSGGGMSDMSALLGSGVEVNIYGDDNDKLLELSDQVAALMGQVEGVTDISNGQEQSDTEIRIIVNKDEAMRLGLTVAQVYAELAQALTTDAVSTSLTVGDETYEVSIIDTTKTPDLESLFRYEFKTTRTDEDGKEVKETHTLGEFATRRDAQSMASIQRENLTRYITVTSSTAEGYTTSRLASQVQEKLDTLSLPKGYSMEIAGETTQVNNMLEQMSLMMALALLMIYLVMVAQFQSLLSPFIVLFTIPLAFTGGALGLAASGEPLSLISLVGFLVLMGVVVNNGIVFVDYVNQLRIGGLSRTEALVATGRTRMRPILMTTMTTVLAMVTMLLSKDVGSEMGRSMAIVVVSGLSYATLMTLFIVPVIYDILYRRSPTHVDVGDDGMDDLPDDAAELAASLGLQPAAAAEDVFPDDPIERSDRKEDPYAQG